MKRKRLLSWVLTFAMIAGMFVVPARADDTITITQDTEGQKGQMTITLTIPKKTPATSNFDYTAPTSLTYDGSAKTATVNAASGVTGMGAITVKYYSDAARTTEVTEAKNVGTYYVGVTVAEGDNYAASTGVLSDNDWSFSITKSTPSAPTAPTAASTTKNSVTLTTVTGCEYSKDGTNWQDSPTFSGLAPSTTYTFYQRVKETDNNDASDSSSASITTGADTYSLTITLVIKEKATVTTAPTAKTLTYSGEAQALVTAGTATGGTMQYALSNDAGAAPESGYTGSIPTGANVGTYYVWYKAAGDTDHRDSDAAYVTAAISKANINPSVTLAGWYYGSAANTPSVTGNPGNGDVSYTYKAKDAEDSTYAADVPTAIGSYTVKATVAATANYNGGEATTDFSISRRPSSGGGNDSPAPATTTVTVPVSGGGNDSSPATTTVTVPVSGEENTVNVSVTVSGDTATVRNTDIDAVLSDTADTGTVTIDVSNVGAEITEAVIPAAMVEKISEAVADENNDADGLEVKLSTGTVTFDATALEAITEQMTGRDLRLNLDDIGENKLNTAQKTTTQEMDVQAVYDAYMTSNNARISDFKGGKATVTVPYELKADQKAAGVTVWYVADNGDKTEMPSTYDGKDVKFTVEHFSNYVIAYDEERAAVCPQDDTCQISKFTDADPTAWYHDGVHYVLENGIMSGYGNGLFGPGSTTSRAMMAQILWKMEGKPVVNYAMSYTDVDGDQWYTEAVRWATSEKIMSGYGNGVFGPNDAMTREQLAAIVYRYAQYKGVDVSVGEDTNILSYDDAFDVSEWAIPAMQWAVGSGAVGGRTTTTLNPKDTATRAEIATIIMRYCTEIA